MKFSTTIALSGLIASALAAPPRSHLPRLHRGTPKQGPFKSGTLASSVEHSSADINVASAATTPVDYNVAWAGAALFDNGQTIYTGVYGEFVVPPAKRPTVGETSANIWTVSSWVGIDGYETSSTCSGLWQAGVDSSIDRAGVHYVSAWYEWYPAATINFDLPIAVGDLIAVDVNYSSLTQGTVTIINKSTGQSESKVVSSTDTLCGHAAEWIMEDLSNNGKTNGLANYGSLTFNKAYATTQSGAKVGPKGSNLMDIQTVLNERLTKTSVTDTSVTIAYV
ncbi:hypothetical protein NHQ30_003423 [Ciborinia camelliae]|nr:hypothetical protein NHQ30_003423 [Ciborinia camelliae]